MRKKFKPLTTLEAIQVYGALVSYCDYKPRDNALVDLVTFVRDVTESGGNYEWRFKGALGFGGKLHGNNDGWYVSCYPEDNNLMRDTIVKDTNAQLNNIIDYGDSKAPF